MNFGGGTSHVFLINLLDVVQVKLSFPGGVYDTKYLAKFFPKLFPATSLEELHTCLAPKAGDEKEDGEVDEEHVEECNEQSASVPGLVDISGKQSNTLANPDIIVHNANGEGLVAPSTWQTCKGIRSAHVINADLSPCKSIDLHVGRASDNILAARCIVDGLFGPSFGCLSCRSDMINCSMFFMSVSRFAVIKIYTIIFDDLKSYWHYVVPYSYFWLSLAENPSSGSWNRYRGTIN